MGEDRIWKGEKERKRDREGRKGSEGTKGKGEGMKLPYSKVTSRLLDPPSGLSGGSGGVLRVPTIYSRKGKISLEYR